MMCRDNVQQHALYFRMSAHAHAIVTFQNGHMLRNSQLLLNSYYYYYHRNVLRIFNNVHVNRLISLKSQWHDSNVYRKRSTVNFLN